MRIFLDVGAHVGETLEEVIKPKYGFDRIVAFEPSAACFPALQAMAQADPRIEIVRAGLSNRTARVPLFQAGSEAGSVIGTLDANPDHGSEVEEIELIETGPWLIANTAETDLVVMKTNCEGSEVDIVENLLETGTLARLYVLLITWDIRMYSGGLAREAALRKRLKAAGADNFCSSDDAMIGRTHCDRIAHWLSSYGLTCKQGSRAELRRDYAAAFARFSGKSGRVHRLEHAFKQRVSYAAFPAPVRSALQRAKRLVGLSRERTANR